MAGETKEMSANEAIRCPKCHNPVLESEYAAHISSGHKDHFIKLDQEEQKKLGNPIGAEFFEMVKAYPRAFFLSIFIAWLVGLVGEYYYLVR